MNCYELYFEKEYPVPAEDEAVLVKLAEAFEDAACGILPERWISDGAAAKEIKESQLDKYLIASAEGWDPSHEYVRIYYWYDTYVDYDMYEHSVGSELILYKDGRVFDLGGKWYNYLRDIVAGKAYPVGTIGRTDLNSETRIADLTAEIMHIVNDEVQLRF